SPSNAWGEVTSWTRWRSIYRMQVPSSERSTTWASKILSYRVRGAPALVLPIMAVSLSGGLAGKGAKGCRYLRRGARGMRPRPSKSGGDGQAFAVKAARQAGAVVNVEIDESLHVR